MVVHDASVDAYCHGDASSDFHEGDFIMETRRHAH
jgi:hypothetical protein